jgi:hypothetical protein
MFMQDFINSFIQNMILSLPNLIWAILIFFSRINSWIEKKGLHDKCFKKIKTKQNVKNIRMGEFL